MPPNQSLIIQDVYKEINKAFDHNLKLFAVDFRELTHYCYLSCSETFQVNTKKILAYFSHPESNTSS